MGYSSYVTSNEGRSGILYGFVGTTSNAMNLAGTTLYGGFGINLFDFFGAELRAEIIGWNTKEENGLVTTAGVTLGVNTFSTAVVVAVVLYGVWTGDFSLVPALLS